MTQQTNRKDAMSLVTLLEQMNAGPSWLAISYDAAAESKRQAAARANASRSQVAEDRIQAWILTQRGQFLTANTVSKAINCAHGVAKRVLVRMAANGKKVTDCQGGLYLVGKIKP
jgi:hypothetical protein